MSKYFDGDKLDYIALPDTNAGISITTTAPVIISSGSRYTQILDENSEFKKQTDSTIKYYSECLECKKKDERIKELELEIKKLKQQNSLMYQQGLEQGKFDKEMEQEYGKNKRNNKTR